MTTITEMPWSRFAAIVSFVLLLGLVSGLLAVGDSASAGTETAHGRAGAGASAAGTSRADDAAQQAPDDEVAVPETYDVYLARDPFEPVVPVVAAASDEGAPSDQPESPDSGAPGNDERPPTGDGAGTPADDGQEDPVCTGEGEVVCDGHVVTLVDVSTDDQGSERATVRIDEASYEVVERQVFATSFAVVSIDPPCVTLLYGDAVFSLCVGEATLK